MEKKDLFLKKEQNVDGLPRLKNVLHVEWLKANLMSISQLCDQKLNVKFTKNSCKVLNKSGKVVLEGSRSSDNCYQLIQSINMVVDDFNNSVGISREDDTVCLVDDAEYVVNVDEANA